MASCLAKTLLMDHKPSLFRIHLILFPSIRLLFLFKMLGVKRIERVLPVGSSLTVVGEVGFLPSCVV